MFTELSFLERVFVCDNMHVSNNMHFTDNMHSTDNRRCKSIFTRRKSLVSQYLYEKNMYNITAVRR